MQERVAAETTEAAKPPAAPVAHGSPVVMRMLALQRGAGNRAVTRMLARGAGRREGARLRPHALRVHPRAEGRRRAQERGGVLHLGADEQPVPQGHHAQGHERPDAVRRSSTT